MERSERDQLEQLIKDMANEYLHEDITNGLVKDGGSINKASNVATVRINECAEAIVRQWERLNAKTNPTDVQKGTPSRGA